MSTQMDSLGEPAHIYETSVHPDFQGKGLFHAVLFSLLLSSELKLATGRATAMEFTNSCAPQRAARGAYDLWSWGPLQRITEC